MLAAAELRIPRNTRIAAHRIVVAIDPEGRPVRQLNGLASWLDAQSNRWRCKPIGHLPTDRLRGYDTLTHPRTFMPMHGCPFERGAAQRALDRGDLAALAGADGQLGAHGVQQLLAPALAAIARINAMSVGPEGGGGLPYPRFGLGANSNSVFSTLLAAMGLDEPEFRAGARFVPGVGTLLLSSADLAACRRAAAA